MIFRLLADLSEPLWRWLAGRIEPYLSTTTHHLEERMSLAEDAIVDLNDATNEVAAELEAALASGAVFDSAIAEKITAAATRLRGLAADPENPVPPVDPEVPAGEGDEQNPNARR